ncbi:conserved hypothetical protein [Cupriavidus taiwanensis]|uniref:hypothetical protein n=1 Tax=Cupriavidus taiwanensis TaxID=164546 RepID=UPI000E1194DF|nr:hypothetical protein [Cupriavidus taiwanensis]SOY79968.1 conserved hypothetical protein [Cupriavidus taiwanensis]SOY81937.1 conserved hypothetical protein [Cupriavidus taiwanensis]
MSEIKDGGPAFPFVEPATECNVATGMTMRDYFAAKALGGMLADPNVRLDGDAANAIAGIAYDLADAMLKAREA